MTLEAITIPSPSDTPKYLLVALHGWGANAQNLARFAPLFNWQETQMMFPDAPFPHPTATGGKMWYDLQQQRDEEGLNQSRQALKTWLASLESETGVPPQRTFLIGFSQGGAMTLDVGFQFPFAGLCALSGYLHSEPQGSSSAPPTLIIHGTQDPVVPITAAQKARDTLQQQGVNVTYQEFPMQHEITPEALKTLKQFLERLS
ncbi:MAG: alpha/beta hydrolase [Halothece sp.]